MSKFEQFLDGLSRSPDDWELRGVFADWCEDDGRLAEAACLRWMIAHRKRPYRGTTGRATWFNADTIAAGLGDPESDVPGAVFALLEGGRAIANHRAYPSHREAEQAFLAGWIAARARGWKPT